MQIPDLINGLLECGGGVFISMSIVKLHRDRLVRGVAWQASAFFTAWGFYNLYFYPHLDQWLSFLGCGLTTFANVIWFGQIIYYKRREARMLRELIARGDAGWTFDDLMPSFKPSIETPFTRLDKPSLEPVKLYNHADK